jgi:hypothetical protein
LDVPPGIYTVSVSGSNFQPASNDTVEVTLGRATPVDFTLQAGGVGTSVNVTASDVSGVDTTESKIQTTFSARQIELIPKGTNFTSVLKAAPPFARR